MTLEQQAHLSYIRSSVSYNYPYKTFEGGMGVWIFPMAYGNGRLAYGPVGQPFIDKAWCYKSVEAAFEAADKWDGEGDPEGWKKSLQTGIYREEFE